MRRLRRFAMENSLSLTFGLLFLMSLAAQAYAGLREFNASQHADGLPTVPMDEYVTSADFAVDVTENWQSEFLQFFLLIVATVWLVQRGSPESKPIDRSGLETASAQKLDGYAATASPQWANGGSFRRRLFSWSLSMTMGAIFVASWFAQSVAGWAAYNEIRLGRLQDPVSWAAYLGSADFWGRSLQNWQSEFLAVGSMAVFSIYLRQRGSSESKRVGDPHDSEKQP